MSITGFALWNYSSNRGLVVKSIWLKSSDERTERVCSSQEICAKVVLKMKFIFFWWDKQVISFSSNLKTGQFSKPIETGVASNDVFKGNRDGISGYGSLMRCESLTFSRVKNHYFVSPFIAKNLCPSFFNTGIEPHKLVLASSFNFSIVFCVKKLKFILECLCWCLISDKDDTKCTLSTETDILGASVV